MRNIISLLLLAMFMLHSCDNPEVIPDDASISVTVNLDWINLTKTPNGVAPNGATIIFFPNSGILKEPVFVLTNDAKTSVSLPAGVYDILVFNETVDGHNHIQFSGTDKYDTFEAYWKTSELKEKYTRGATKSAVVNTDDMLLVERLEGFEITREMAINGTPSTLNFTPKIVNIAVTITAIVEGLDNVAKGGSLVYMEGMSSGFNLSTGKPAGVPTTHLMTINNKKFDDNSFDTGTMSASFYIFGLSKDILKSSTDNIARCSFTLRDGSTHPDIIRDISSKINGGDDIQGIANLTVSVGTGSLDGIDPVIRIPYVPDAEDPGSGFDADLDIWEDIIEDIVI